MSEDCALCRILSGQIGSDPLYENETLVAMLNRWEPLSRGHALIFPKRHVASLHEMSVAELSDVLPIVKRLVVALDIGDYNVIQNNGALAHQTVFHAHFHLIPKWSESEGLGLTWNVVRGLDQSEVYARMIAHLVVDNTA
jgi:diadenosine tetraphosphate (Ap4A) HIT family hydrolase